MPSGSELVFIDLARRRIVIKQNERKGETNQDKSCGGQNTDLTGIEANNSVCRFGVLVVVMVVVREERTRRTTGDI